MLRDRVIDRADEAMFVIKARRSTLGGFSVMARSGHELLAGMRPFYLRAAGQTYALLQNLKSPPGLG